ncbi:ensconsin isoform X23 [Sitodiplosis mosellana]|uniref:ensconsin isoform X23 n=1 Tax=Sitodiplosis mosellana TaxID=263140 RepID=UPI002443BE80|nr:ensconsin isoform X23 [Sitodiplosis mosellana]
MASPGITDNKSIIKQQNSMVGSFTDASPQKQDGTRKSRDRDERLRLIKDQQNLERQKKLDELKAQAMAAQKYREQKEEERKRRIEEMRLRENDKRQQVEDRKKAIEEAERERREYIVRKNQERETRLDTKRRNERSSISFAFGSSTPRLLDPVEVNLVAPTGSYWNNRRSTSITNVSYGGGGATQLSRRSSERELSDGAKKRATSASGLDRPDDDSNDTSPFVIRSVARRKTDLIPTIPIRDSSFGSRTSLYCSTPRTQGSRSGDVTPGGSSRPGSAMSTSTMSTSGVVRRSGGTRKPRPSSIAGTGMTPDCNESSKPQKKDRPPSRPSSAVRRSSSTTTANATKEAQAAASPKMSTSLHETPKRSVKSAPPKKTATPRGASTPKLPSPQTESATPKTVPNETPENSVEIVQTVEQVNEPIAVEEVKIVETKTVETVTTTEVVSGDGESVQSTETHEIKTEITSESEPVSNVDNIDNNKLTEPENNEMTASMIQRRVLSEHEAKAALAERRRLAREEAERQAELERQKQEEERQRELQLQAEEEEKQRQFELEAQRLVEEQRQAEEKRLQQAIEEARQREEAERLRKADEEKQRLEREEQEKKAREEAERQKIEVAERLKKEEKEREERRKRVEAIMSRTRAKTAAANNFASNTPNKAENEAGNNGVNSTESTQPSTEPAQDDETSANNTKNALGDYEKSVTDKENALIHTFSNLIENNLISTPTQQSPQHHADNNGVHKTNGKLIDFTLNDEHQPPISNGNGFSLDNKIESGIGIGNNYNDSITNQLLDLSLDTNQTAEHTVNFNNNSLITSAPLVTSDSHEAKEISLL